MSVGFSRQEYWSGLPCPPPGGLPNPGVTSAGLTSPALADRLLTSSAIWEALATHIRVSNHPFYSLNFHMLYVSCMSIKLREKERKGIPPGGLARPSGSLITEVRVHLTLLMCCLCGQCHEWKHPCSSILIHKYLCCGLNLVPHIHMLES